MKKPIFYQAVLVPVNDVIAHVYPKQKEKLTLDERLPEGKCEECGGTEWFLLPVASVAVKEGGKPYIECLGCGFQTHL